MCSTQTTTAGTLRINDYKDMNVNINDLLGKPYKDHARGPEAYDCYGLAIEVARRYGYVLNDVVYTNHNIELSTENAPTLNVTKVERPYAGALIEMQCGNELHIGVCISSKEFIHMTSLGCRINLIGTFKVRGYYGINTRI